MASSDFPLPFIIGLRLLALLREHFGSLPTEGLKALLAAAPLEGIGLVCERDFGRDVEL